MFKLSTSFLVFAMFATLSPVSSAPALFARHEGHSHSEPAAGSATTDVASNALDAQRMNSRFADIQASDSCQVGDLACIDGGFAQCANGRWVVQPCANGLRCYAVPLINSRGTSIVCDTQEATLQRFENAGVSGGIRGDQASEDDELPFCDELPDGGLYSRQEGTPAPVTLTTLPGPATDAPSPSSSGVESSSAPSSASSSTPIVTPTVVVGTNGIVTVTVVSTVFATPTDCGVASGSLPAATSIPVSSSGVSSSGAIPTSSAGVSSSGAPSGTISSSPSASSASATVIKLTAVVVSEPSVSATSSAVATPSVTSAINNNDGGKPTFIFDRRAAPTPAA